MKPVRYDTGRQPVVRQLLPDIVSEPRQQAVTAVSQVRGHAGTGLYGLADERRFGRAVADGRDDSGGGDLLDKIIGFPISYSWTL